MIYRKKRKKTCKIELTIELTVISDEERQNKRREAPRDVSQCAEIYGRLKKAFETKLLIFNRRATAVQRKE